ncbi:hypothetical protein [Nostoc sp.]|uniref:hypothetical protein n=1 Tax=Nostoc sp. TaxID=1180 RepID=UPI002FF79ED6
MKINWKTGIIALATFVTFTPLSSVLAKEFNDKVTPETNIISASIDSNNVYNLDGTWDYQVSYPASKCSVQGYCSIKIVGGIGRYASPTDNNSIFLVNIYPTTINRGQPVLTITQIGTTGVEVHYTAALNGRLDQPGLITGRFVDVENNQGTFTLKKQ